MLHAPVSGYMSAHNVKTVTPDTPLISARKIISLNDVGRLPVLENGRLVGIIARSDILNGHNGKTRRPASAAAPSAS
jgi:tRNA nucleotidyltransferase (CCA-adding enzyme)